MLHMTNKLEKNFYSGGASKDFGVSVCSNGTTALHLALLSLNIGEGDEVIVPDLGYIAAVNSVLYVKATPVLVDVNENWTLDVNLAKKALTSRTRAIICIDNYGKLCDYAKLREAIPDSVVVIQDAAESFPGHPKNETAGIQGDLATFSFYANKVITSGEGGAILASKDRIQKIDRIKSQNLEKIGAFKHAGIGYNYRITNLQAAVFRGQWLQRKKFMNRRLWVFNTYEKFLTGHEFLINSNLRDNPWLVTLQLKITGKQMDLLAKHLKDKGIGTRRCFTPASEHDYVKAESIHSGELSNAKQLSEQIISLPTYPSLSKKKIKYIVETLLVEYKKVSEN